MSVSVHTARKAQSPSFRPFSVVAPKLAESELVSGFDAAAGSDPLFFEFSQIFESLVRRTILARKLQVGLVELSSGSKYQVDLDDRFAAQLWAGRLAEARDLNVFCRMVRPGAFIVDVGANFGLYAVESGRLSGGEASVVAFEPVPRQFAFLEKNILANGLARTIAPLQKAASSRSGMAEFHVAQSNSFSGLRDTGRSKITETINVPTSALDEEPLLAVRPVDLLKIDVEGSELDVLRGAQNLIARSPDLVILLEATIKNQSLQDQRELVQWIEQRLAEGWLLHCGFHGDIPGDLIENVDAAGRLMHGNLFLARKASPTYAALADAIGREALALTKARERASDSNLVARLIAPLLRSELDAFDKSSVAEKSAANETLAAFVQQREDEARAAKEREDELYRQFDEAKSSLEEAMAANEKQRREFDSERNHSAKQAKEMKAALREIKGELDAHIVRERELRLVLKRQRAAHAAVAARFDAVMRSPWWRFGQRFVFPVRHPFRRRTPGPVAPGD